MNAKPQIVPYVCTGLMLGRNKGFYIFHITYVHRNDYKSGMAQFWIDDVPMHQLGMSPDFADWIQKNCVCARCGARVLENLAPCGCGKQQAPYIEVLYSISDISGINIHENELLRLEKLSRERLNRTEKTARRKSKLVQSGRRSTKKEKLALLEVQDFRCFYCGENFQTEGAKDYHFDHYVSLADGGSDGLENIVCACKKCNMKKNSVNGSQFSAVVTKSLNQEMKVKVWKLRAKVRAYKKKYLRSQNG